jgi:hypothetical protein
MSTNRKVANLPPEEPDAGNLHVRVCEGASGQPLALLGGDKKEMNHLINCHGLSSDFSVNSPQLPIRRRKPRVAALDGMAFGAGWFGSVG